jgi:hypothetical protein
VDDFPICVGSLCSVNFQWPKTHYKTLCGKNQRRHPPAAGFAMRAASSKITSAEALADTARRLMLVNA